MILYRFGADTKRTASEEFDGTGGLLGAGRWHLKGTKVVYASNSEPLALLEKIVHRGASKVLVYPLYFAVVPDALVEELPANQLPRDWKSIYPPKSTMECGAQWLASNRFVALLLPSVLISGRDGSRNCIINPAHPEIGRVVFSGLKMIALDPRFPVLLAPRSEALREQLRWRSRSARSLPLRAKMFLSRNAGGDS